MPASTPFFRNETQKDMYQGIDRRMCHYRWCTNAFNHSNQPCTAVISFEDVPHTNPGTRELEIVWLEEVMKLRLPENIPTDGTPYQLIPVDPRKVGGHVYAKATSFEGRTIHTDVEVGYSLRPREEGTLMTNGKESDREEVPEMVMKAASLKSLQPAMAAPVM